MDSTNQKIIKKDSVVVKFAGDSGDGMQLAGTLFADTAALEGNDLSTFPYYPAEIRPPHNTVAGVSGFQVNVGGKVLTSGDEVDILVCMNPASLAANLKVVKIGGTILADADNFSEKAYEKAGYKNNPLEDDSLNSYRLLKVPMTSLAKIAAEEAGADGRLAERTRNIFALGMILSICDYDIEKTFHLLEKKFSSKPVILESNKKSLLSGYAYADSSELSLSKVQLPVAEIAKGRYRNITGNIATAWGLLAAAERSGRQLFLGSYPITPATEILMELAAQKSLGTKVFQAEDEIGGVCSAIGASFAGAMAVTTTSGPGLSLKTEALGLAVITELPLVVVNVQRGGPSTGMPTKSEQSDLNMALFGRNGEAPMIVFAASSAADCFYKAYETAKYSMEHMTPAILLTDGQMGQGSELFRIPKVSELPEIVPPIAKANDENYQPYKRDMETLARQWAIPGTEGLRHRIGGLEKTDGKGMVSTDPLNHELMSKYRAEKVQKVAERIPLQDVVGEQEGDVLVVSWGGTFGAVRTAVNELHAEGKSIGHAHFGYIMPLPRNTADIFKKFKKIIVCELNLGQFVNYLRMVHPDFTYEQYNKIQGLPFDIQELKDVFNKML
ncbi:MAG: 2-oxoacid:acceptor oxidoreductase subunit alpha [Bacteroidales bacterium]|jgi:2-oxoglutarate ferredoxin oxidoreductase subunit alpha|nr:2-oxoacid:acceptor oxidoreductase subunit alpha [Bacteroidales bacterium]